MRQQSDLDALAVFSKVVETRSFSAAARAKGTTTSAVSKRIAGLEARLGVRLLVRTTRRVSLTEAGSTFHAHVLRILADVTEAEDAVARLGRAVRGTLRISAPVIFGQRHVAPVVAALVAEHPELRVDLTLADRYVNLAEEGFDVAVRIGELGDSSLVAVKLGELASVVCAAPAYLARRGTPRIPLDLGAHDCIRFSLLATAREWRFRGDDGRELSVPVSGRLALDDGIAMVHAAVAGAGIVRLPSFIVEDALGRGELVEVLADRRTKPRPVSVIHPHARHVPPKVRVFVDAMRRLAKFGLGERSRAPT